MKYDLSVAVMYHGEPIMYLLRYESSVRFNPFGVLCRKFPFFTWRATKVDVEAEYAEYLAAPDDEVSEVCSIVAIFQRIES